MTEHSFYSFVMLASVVTGVLSFITLFFISAPYGRHIRKGWGKQIASPTGWLIMESTSAVLFLVFFLTGSAPKNLTAFIFLILWEAHYFHRAFIYPFTLRDGQKRMPISIILMGMAFNLGNTYINGRYLFHLSGGYPDHWLADWRFITGVVIFLIGYAINRWADTQLRSLRKPGEVDYNIPHGGLFRWVSCPNYLGEIIEWSGWAIATWSLPGLAFAFWTFANLAPRAFSHHNWYRKTFPDYPKERRAIIPWVF